MRQINITSNWIAITEDDRKKIDWIINPTGKCLHTNSKLSSDFYVNSDGLVLKSSQFLLVLFMEK